MAKATKGKIKAALAKHDGAVVRAATDLGMARQSLHDRINGDPDLAKFAADIREGMGEFARGNVYKALRDGDLTTSRWFLERIDPEFKNTVGIRLGDREIAEIVGKVAEAGGAEALRKLADSV